MLFDVAPEVTTVQHRRSSDIHRCVVIPPGRYVVTESQSKVEITKIDVGDQTSDGFDGGADELQRFINAFSRLRHE